MSRMWQILHKGVTSPSSGFGVESVCVWKQYSYARDTTLK